MPNDVGPDARVPPWGAVPDGSGHWNVGIWLPSAAEVQVALPGRIAPAARCVGGHFQARIAAQAGETYRFLADGEALPDPAARAQEDGVHGASRLTDPAAYRWSSEWHGRPWHEAVICELHIGTFTEEGTFRAASGRLGELAALGFTAIEIMPVAQFAGTRGWGYDGVLPYAPHTAYGTSQDMQAFVEAAQALGLMVILDVVYNHFGSEGARLPAEFFDAERHTPWGAGIDFTMPAVRRFFLDNAVMWLRDYRLDGLRLDAVHQIVDPSDPDFLVELGRTVRSLDLGRPVHLITEDERNLPDLRESGLYAAEWNDDYHHAIHVLLTGESQGYYAPFAVNPMADLVQALREGQVRQGQDRGDDSPRGAPSGHLPVTAFVNANQTHDQIGNRARGERLITLADPQAAETAHALLLLAPFIPMLFMGEEAGATTPFLFFADLAGELGEKTRAGRIAELAAISDGALPPDPLDIATFHASRPVDSDARHAAHWRALTAELLALRAAHVVPLLASGGQGPAQCRQTGPRALTASWPFAAGTLTLHVNLGTPPDTAPETAGAIYALRNVSTDSHALCLLVTP